MLKYCFRKMLLNWVITELLLFRLAAVPGREGGSIPLLNRHGICIELLPYRKWERVSTSAEQSATSVGSTASGLLLQNCSADATIVLTSCSISVPFLKIFLSEVLEILINAQFTALVFGVFGVEVTHLMLSGSLVVISITFLDCSA